MMRKILPANRAVRAQKSIGKPHWRASALALATVALMGVSASDAYALALGRISVQSALGEPLRAEIEIPEINAEELASLRTAVASPDAFRSAGLEYNPALATLTIKLERRPDGRHFLTLSSQRAVNEPFLDLILETNWSSGRIVRDYTMLFDPPNLRPAAQPLAAQVSPVAPSSVTPQPVRPAPAARVPAARSAARQSAAREPASGDRKQVTVRSGDTAGTLAAANKPSNISLDQMLVAILRANPEAFIGGNINRLRAGAVLDIPSAEQAALLPSGEARQTVVAQSRDFNEFRRRLAEGLPTTRIAAGDRQASGKVQAQVEDKKPAAASPDKLTLSKGAVQDKGTADKIARDRAAQDAATRVAELNKNIADLNKLGSATAPAGSGSAAKPPIAVPVGAASAAKPAIPAPTVAAATVTAKPLPAVVAPVPVPPPVPVPAPVPVAAAATAAAPMPAAPAPAAAASMPLPTPAAAAAPMPAPASSAAPASPASDASSIAATPVAAQASAPAATPVKAAASRPKPAVAPLVETSLIDDMLENPIVPATLGGVLALALGFGFYRARQRKKSGQVDSSFLESRLQPDSFFGASGGQRIDTKEGAATGSSMVYSPSQLDAAGDVDPVAEADVYLAYGRDLQAEEILKEAMRTSPQRVAIHSKLLEIYAKRRDSRAFELIATGAHGLTKGEGPEWEHICQLGHELDPSNPLYRPGGQPGTDAMPAGTLVTAARSVPAMAAHPVPAAAAAAADVDLDLDFSLGDDEPVTAKPPARPSATPEPTLAFNVLNEPEASMPSMDFNFADVFNAPAASSAAAAQSRPHQDAPSASLAENSLDFDIQSVVATPPAPAPAQAAPPAAAVAAPAADAGMIQFDLGALSLDLDSPPAQAPATASVSEPESESANFPDTGDDPLAIKLALAQEFNAIGDPDGARSLAQEVLAEASGDLKNQARRFLAEIS